MRLIKYRLKKSSLFIIATLFLCLIAFNLYDFSFADAKLGSMDNPYSGFPKKIRIKLDNLDREDLIYCGIDVAVFYDPDLDGEFEVMPNDKKIKRIITRNRAINLKLGSIKDYKIGVPHKLKVRVLFTPTGTKQDTIVIAGHSVDDGWRDIPNTVFIPSYFINAPGTSYITHTEKWEENRVIFNASKSDSKKRDKGVFWAGEKLMLHIETAMPVSKVEVKINDLLNSKGNEYKKVLTSYEMHPTIEDAAIYEGFLWEKDMINTIGNYKPKEKEVYLEIYDDEGIILERKKVKIVFYNKEAFYRIRRAI